MYFRMANNNGDDDALTDMIIANAFNRILNILDSTHSDWSRVSDDRYTMYRLFLARSSAILKLAAGNITVRYPVRIATALSKWYQHILAFNKTCSNDRDMNWLTSNIINPYSICMPDFQESVMSLNGCDADPQYRKRLEQEDKIRVTVDRRIKLQICMQDLVSIFKTIPQQNLEVALLADVSKLAQLMYGPEQIRQPFYGEFSIKRS